MWTSWGRRRLYLIYWRVFNKTIFLKIHQIFVIFHVLLNKTLDLKIPYKIMIFYLKKTTFWALKLQQLCLHKTVTKSTLLLKFPWQHYIIYIQYCAHCTQQGFGLYSVEFKCYLSMAIDLSLIVLFSNRFYPKAGDPGNRTHNPAHLQAPRSTNGSHITPSHPQ